MSSKTKQPLLWQEREKLFCYLSDSHNTIILQSNKKYQDTNANSLNSTQLTSQSVVVVVVFVIVMNNEFGIKNQGSRIKL